MPDEIPLRVGDVLYGYCGGYFGDSYEDKRVEAIGTDWVVAREMGYISSNNVYFHDGNPELLKEYRTREPNG